jgi:MYND finger
MYANLTRERDEAILRTFTNSSIRGLNLDRIRSIIEASARDSEEQSMLVQSIDQVVAYEPELLRLDDVKIHFFEYCIMQESSAAVLRKVLELWPLTDQSTLERGLRDAPTEELKAVITEYMMESGRTRGSSAAAGNTSTVVNPAPSPPQAVSTTTTAARCGWHGCHKGPVLESSLKSCARCVRIKYCSKQCQKSAWQLHKIVCVDRDVPRHRVDSLSVEAIIETVSLAQPGDVILIPAGNYNALGETNLISITKPLTLIGDGMYKVTLNCDLKVEYEATVGGKFTVSNLTIHGVVRVSQVPGDVTFLSATVQCPREREASNAFELANCNGKVLLTCCEIFGGLDGLFLTNSPKVHIQQTDISLARARGIFAANDCFLIEDSAVYNCGAYGIKGRRGWKKKGDNQIQAGPWNSF